jgi:hypothetical protein
VTGYLSAPVEQLALPGSLASGEITPEGDIYTGWGEYQLLLGRGLRPWRQPTRILPKPSVPLFVSSLNTGALRYSEQVFTIAVAGEPVTYLILTASNPGREPRRARVSLGVAYSKGPVIKGYHGVLTGAFRYERPAPNDPASGGFFQLGESFSPSWRYSLDGQDVVRDGLLLARGSAPAAAVSTPAARSFAAPGIEVRYLASLAPRRSFTWTWQIPLAPPAAGQAADAALAAVSPQLARAQLANFWRGEESGLTAIKVPERRVNAVYLASVVALLQARYSTAAGWVQGVNRLQYQSYWIRDSSVETVALDDVGLHALAAENLAYLARWQQPDGLYISRIGQQDGVGEALWELAQHASLTQAPAFAAAQLSNVKAAVDWIDRASMADRMGLLPPSTVYDDEFVIGGHITGDDLWAAMGLRSAVRLAQLADQPQLAAAWTAIDQRFETALRRALARAFAHYGHITPALDSNHGRDWGNYWLAYPISIVDPRDSMVLATMKWAQAHSREGLASYARTGILHDYLGFPVFETDLENGNVAAALRGFYSELVHTTAPGFGWEDGPVEFGTRRNALNLSPHGTFAGQFVTMLRNMLVREDGNGIDLLSGVSPAWMRAGDRISVSHAPTYYGEISFTLVVDRSGAGATLRWQTAVPTATRVRWVLPYWLKLARTSSGRAVRGALALHGRSGSVTLAWSAHLPRVSAANTIAALNRAYRARGKKPPFVPAPGW